MSTSEQPGGRWVGRWQVESVGAAVTPERVAATLTLTEGGQVTGHGGVNSFSGRYAVVGEQIEFGPLMATLLAGPEPAGRFEAALLAGLSGRRRVRADGATLVIGRDDTEIRCRRA